MKEEQRWRMRKSEIDRKPYLMNENYKLNALANAFYYTQSTALSVYFSVYIYMK